MNSYNGRQITQMKWQDVKELEKFKFISDEFSFVSEVLEEASKHKPWSKIVKVIENGYAYKPVLIFDTIDNELYFGTQENDTLYLQNLYANHGSILEIQYTKATDKLTITSTEENFLSDDNVKTLFGTESIIGTGNIDLFTHFLTLTASDGSVLYINYPSSNKLECDSLQDLTAMTKATKTSGTKIGFGSTYIIYDSTGIWKTANNTAITQVKDKVFTI